MIAPTSVPVPLPIDEVGHPIFAGYDSAASQFVVLRARNPRTVNSLPAGDLGVVLYDNNNQPLLLIQSSGTPAVYGLPVVNPDGSSIGSGSGGGAATIANGADVAEGATTDAVVAAGAAGTISAKLRALSRDLVANIVLAAGSNHIGEVGGNGVGVQQTIVRPADTNFYTAGDVISTSTGTGTIITFTGVGRVPGGSGMIIKARLTTNNASITPRIRLWLFNVANPFIPNDNAPMDIRWADRASRLGYIDFPALATEGGSSDCAQALVADARFEFQCGADANLYGIAEPLDGFTPTSGQSFLFELCPERN